jgi:hypothetical protein
MERGVAQGRCPLSRVPQLPVQRRHDPPPAPVAASASQTIVFRLGIGRRQKAQYPAWGASSWASSLDTRANAALIASTASAMAGDLSRAAPGATRANGCETSEKGQRAITGRPPHRGKRATTAQTSVAMKRAIPRQTPKERERGHRHRGAMSDHSYTYA